MKHYLLYIPLVVTTLLASCVSTKKYSTFVDDKLQAETVAQENTKYENWLIVNTDKIVSKENQYHQLKYSFIPAVFYWGWNSTIACEINPALTASYIKSSIYKAADSLNLLEKSMGRKLIINLKQVPGKFLYENRGNTIFLVVAYTVSGSESILPDPVALVADFETKTDDIITTSTELRIQNKQQPMANIWKSSKKFTWLYLDEYKKETDRMGLELVKGLLQKL